MAHDPRIFVGPQQSPDGTGHQLHCYPQNSQYAAVMAANATSYGLRELTAAEYTAWDAGNHTFSAIQSHGGR